MDVVTPHQIVFETNEPVPIADLVASLLGAEQLFRDVAPLLEAIFPGFRVERINVSVREVSQESPLRELFVVGLIATFQKDLEKDVPAVIEHLSGAHIPDEYHSIIALVFCIIAFYGIHFIFSQLSNGAFSKHIRDQFDEFTKELSRETGLSEEKISSVLQAKYGKSRVRVLAHSALGLFAPSKREHNVPVIIDGRRIGSEIIADIPSSAQIDAANVPETVKPFENVQIELHAQDIDHAKQGWAAVVPKVGSKRLRMEIYPPIKPEEIYTKKGLRGDIMLVSRKKSDGTYHPAMFYLLNITESE
jgi:hypothetical protein